ncbi:MAG TPA: hypothetical protein PK636_02720 [bacterium]|nr:hypothetical protein [bacterium]HPJ71578.1 hypothetical protein [bacterium]HPQ65896.1 hypothetical protein [bacterium]
MKRFLTWSLVVLMVLFAAAFVVFQFVLKQKPFAAAEDYSQQFARHRLTLDVAGHWNQTLGTIDVISYSQNPVFPLPVPSPYDLTMMKQWVAKNRNNPVELQRVYGAFASDPDYGWPEALQGVVWMYGLIPRLWAAASIAMVEPGRTAEAAFVLREGIQMLRSPACWKDYAVNQAWGDPMRDNVMWKGPLLIAEGLYALVSGDKDTFGPEMTAVARDLYETQKKNLALPVGQGYVGGVCCEPNHWFPQCNSMGCVGLALYDKVYGKDQKHGVLIGEEYRNNYMRFLREEMTDPETGMVYRRYHPYGPQQADKDLSGFANIFVAMNMRSWEPGFSGNIYRQIRERYIKGLPLGIGSFMLEVPEKDAAGALVNPGAAAPGMLGETAVNIFLALAAAREFDDPETFDGINELITNFTHPYFRQGEIRFDETNDEPAGVGDFSVGALLNMFSGWWMFAKVHQGWETILEYDWSANRDEDGRPLNNP